MSSGPAQHWLVGVAQRAGLAGADALNLPAGTPPSEAWAAVCAALPVRDGDLAQAVARHFKLAVADLSAAAPRALKLLPETFARRYHVFPLREDDRRLTIATADPTNLDVEQTLVFAAGRAVVFEVAPPAVIDQAIETRYSPERVVEDLLGKVGAEKVDSVSVVEEEEQADVVRVQETEAAPVIKLTNLILHDAVTERASDIHIEPGRAGGTVRFRVDGVLRQYMRIPMPALNRVVSRIKVLSNIDIADRLRPQDGRTRIRVDQHNYDLRVSTVPTRDAEKAVVRILDSQGAPRLEELGVLQHDLDRLRRLLAHRNGIVTVTGPTGSGKTTTLYS
ncbi:MAG: Flp pilus assembly complex ATPase component TadA, partial [Gemmatimonadetes bacterium]|nr:Flp pilus assembly complex ATPase component TadA [Gemmatimonadota bacterium]